MSTSSEIIFHPVTLDRKADFELLFEEKGGPKYCWCMAWRKVNEESGKTDNERRKNSILDSVDKNIPIGILGYVDKKPVAWCSIAPRNTYSKLGGTELDTDEGNIWSLVCFYLKKEYRKQGLSELILEAAIQYAKSKGAKYVEAYPVDANSPSYRFMGFVPLFEHAGFKFQHTVGTRRNVMLLTLS